MTLPLTAPELAGFRLDLAGALADVCTVERDASQDGPPDPFGHPLPPVWEEHLAAAPCSLWSPGSEASEDPAETHRRSWRLALPDGTDLRPYDRVTSVIDAAGLERLERPAAVDSVTAFPTHVEAVLTERTW